MKFKKLILRDDPLYGNAELPIEPGLTVVYGLNRVTKASRNGNFAGKSYLLSQIPETIWETPVIGTREDRNSVGTRELQIKLKGADYSLVKSKKLQVYKDGKLLFKNVRDTKQWVSELPITEQEFLGLYYLDSRRHHPLVMGTSTERSAYLTKFFSLDRIDQEKKKVNSKLAELKTYRAQLTEVESNLKTLQDNKPNKVNGDISALQAKLDVLRKRQNKFLLMQRARDFANSVKPQLKLLASSVDFDKLNKQQLREAIHNRKIALYDDSLLLKDAKGWAEYKAQKKDYDRATEGLTAKQLKALNHIEAYKKAYDKYVALRDTLVDLDARPVKPKKVAQPEVDVYELHDTYKRHEHEYIHATKFKTGKCPTCGSNVKVRPIEVIKKALHKSEIKYLKAREGQLAYETYAQERTEYKVRLSTWKAAKAKHDSVKGKLSELKHKALTYRSIRNVPEPPPSFTGKRVSLEVTERMVQEDRDFLHAAKMVLSSVKLLRHMSKEYPDVSAKLDKINATISTHQLARAEYARYKAQLKQLAKRQHQLQFKLKDEPALQLLAKAYNDKGMKKMAIEAACRMLSEQLNKYSSVVFPARYRFSIEWTKSKLSFLCTRPNNRTTDVRKLSGAESRLFTYLLVFAQLQFVPKQRRSNLMVLDEPTTNMHEETAESFKKLLTLMRSIIPCIVVITPQMDHYEDAKAITIVRDNGKSRIVRGTPNSI